jgi:small subunit ribosomal protein S6
MRDTQKEHQSYEVAMLVHPSLSEKDVQKVAQEAKDLLVQFGASAVSDERIERRALAYPVQKQNEANYIYIYFTGPTSLPDKVRYELRHREGLIRMAFVRKPIPAAEPEPAPAPEVPPAPEPAPAPAEGA